ncbi:MAG: hypothetical protein IT440_03685 [Phycisphaeraceae bacterium]|nr:hypothetical protein [Phycisphaeraceae bacterium]
MSKRYIVRLSNEERKQLSALLSKKVLAAKEADAGPSAVESGRRPGWSGGVHG